jgi:NADPH:quinone reductase-like Zn-dependent oxidoreductase
VKAVVHDRYGPPEVLRLEEVDRPAPNADDVLVRVRATTVTRSDCALRSNTPFFSRLFTGIRRPKQRVLGTEFAGEVEAVGAGVTEFHAGDRVFGASVFGAHAELVLMRESGAIAHMPAGLTFDEAAAVCDGAILALNALAPVTLAPGRAILVYGASGSIGTACSWRSISARTSLPSATPGTSSSCARWGPTRSSTIRRKTSGSTASSTT